MIYYIFILCIGTYYECDKNINNILLLFNSLIEYARENNIHIE